MNSTLGPSNIRPLVASSKVLLTAFDAFGSLTVNPSHTLLERVVQEVPALSTIVLPTSYRRGWNRMWDAIDQEHPSAIIMLGYSRAVTGMQLEQCADNADTSRQPDNDGQVGSSTVVPGAPARLAATMPVAQLASRHALLTVAGSPSGFVCNHIYYRTLLALKTAGRDIPCVFVHVGDWQQDPAAADIIAATVALVAVR